MCDGKAKHGESGGFGKPGCFGEIRQVVDRFHVGDDYGICFNELRH